MGGIYEAIAKVGRRDVAAGSTIRVGSDDFLAHVCTLSETAPAPQREWVRRVAKTSGGGRWRCTDEQRGRRWSPVGSRAGAFRAIVFPSEAIADAQGATMDDARETAGAGQPWAHATGHVAKVVYLGYGAPEKEGILDVIRTAEVVPTFHSGTGGDIDLGTS